MSDKVVNVPLFYSVREGGVNKVRGSEGVLIMVLTKLKKVIVLSGRANSGKTAILNKLCDTIDATPGTIINPNEQEYSRSSLGDQRHCVTYRGKRVAVSTAGDTADQVFKSFLYAEKRGVEVLVLALSCAVLRGYRTAEVAFDEIVRNYRLKPILDNSVKTVYAPPKIKGYVDMTKVKDLLKKI